MENKREKKRNIFQFCGRGIFEGGEEAKEDEGMLGSGKRSYV